MKFFEFSKSNKTQSINEVGLVQKSRDSIQNTKEPTGKSDYSKDIIIDRKIDWDDFEQNLNFSRITEYWRGSVSISSPMRALPPKFSQGKRKVSETDEYWKHHKRKWRSTNNCFDLIFQPGKRFISETSCQSKRLLFLPTINVDCYLKSL